MWKAVSYEPQYLNGMLAMAREQYGEENDICDEAFLTHQYFENPAGDAFIELAVDPDDDRLAGQYIVSPARFRCFGKEVRCVTSLNTLTREAYRGQGIFIRLAERVYGRAAADGYGFVYGAPNENSYPGFMRDLAFEDIHHFPLYVRPLDLSQMVEERFGKGLLSRLAKPFNALFPFRERGETTVIELTEENCPMIDGFWQEVKDKYPVMGVRDAEYVRYRYLDVPRRQYYPYVAMDGDRPVAFAVGRVREVAGFRCGMVADFLFVKGYERAARNTLRVVVGKMKAAGASLAGCVMLAHADEADQLKRCGFFRCPHIVLPQSTPLILRVFDKGLKKNSITDIRNWFFTTGDYDVV